MAGQLVAFTPKKVGRSVEAGKSCATIESGKWVGPAKIAFEAEVVEVNEALVGNPKLANADPYGEGWMVKVKPADWDAGKADADRRRARSPVPTRRRWPPTISPAANEPPPRRGEHGSEFNGDGQEHQEACR